MEKLRTLVNTELAKSEFIRTLNSKVSSDQVIRDIRLALYNEARGGGLMDEGDQPVTRRKVATGKSVREKHIDDIWCLVCSIKDSKQINRVLLKNGKRSLKQLEQSRKSSGPPANSQLGSPPLPPIPSTLPSIALCDISASQIVIPDPVVPTNLAAPYGGPPPPQPCSPAEPPSSSVVSCAAPQSPQDGKFFKSSVMGEIQKAGHQINKV